ncbi:DUF3367 domain-containing protein [Nocardioides guangzhouensis]|uniref:DUF3367 domain-containing protein n=1 Tax=Nocardioides guangzhouensis TaxID=2497878 RepID=A0A4Q4ZCC3_9ACTN|nr:alpha-(1->3)-arabinofuranosyltransferase family protein [Nocardioides guangzhouensis]RYP84946.1 DUF3367 domain-containing protein [Nocardioides guangzhouensis]
MTSDQQAATTPTRVVLEEKPSLATAPLRLVGYVAVLAACAFAQSSGRTVADTKWDLAATPLRFLVDGTRMWDANQAFGQIQNQAYGYLWPMGPFFVLGDVAGLAPWVVQRLWWTLLMSLAFFGVLRLCRELRVGKPWAQVVAAFAFVLAPRMTSLLGETSVELWPTALAPWVLVPLVIGSREGSVRKAAAASALLVACCGGVNATAVAAVLPLGAIWILTRAPGPRRWRLLCWWTGLTILATAWWLVPLVLQGGYSPPFLDYIENAHVTSVTTDLVNTFLGTSDWVVYLAPENYPAGARLVTTPFMMLDAAALAAVGLAGLVKSDHPERRFLLWGLLTGLTLVGLGYAGQHSGWFADARLELLDQALSPLRNTHKFDVVLRLVLALGLAHALSSPLVVGSSRFGVRAARVIWVAVVVTLVGLAVPWARGDVAAPGGFTAMPAYWNDAATYLDDLPEGGTALEVPAADFGDYTWGSTHDDAIQPFARAPWAARNVVPLAEPGNVVLLDGVTEILESGLPSDRLAPLLGRSGVDHLVVRNDLQRLLTGAPDPAYVHAALDRSPGLTRVASFGPLVGERRAFRGEDGTRVVVNGGLSGTYPAIEVYRVDDAPGPAVLADPTATLMGDPGTPLPDAGAVPDGPKVLTGDAPATDVRRVVLSDGMRRRSTAFQAVRRNTSATTHAGSSPQLPGPEQFHRILADQERWQVTETWQGIAGVGASSSQAWTQAGPPLDRGTHPGAALDEDRGTAWRTARNQGVDGQWIEVRLAGSQPLAQLRLALAPDSAPVPRVRVSAGGEDLDLTAPEPGSRSTYRLSLPSVDRVRVTFLGGPDRAGAQLAVSELSLGDVEPHRVLRLPPPPETSLVDRIVLQRDQGASSCPTVVVTVVCQPLLGSSGEDGDRLDRSFTLNAGNQYRLEAVGSLRRHPHNAARLSRLLGARVTSPASRPSDIAESTAAMVDGDLGTSWVGTGNQSPAFAVRLPSRRPVKSLTFEVGDAAPVSRPQVVRVRADGRAAVRTVGDDGTVELPGWRVRRFTVEVLATASGVDVSGQQLQRLPAGVSELRVNGQRIAEQRLPRGWVRWECGAGPDIDVNGRTVQTSVFASVAALLRGERVRLAPCDGGDVALQTGDNLVEATPSRLFRVDSLSFRDASAVAASSRPVPLARDSAGAPESVDVPRRASGTLLVLGQNYNPGWRATLDGVELTPQRVAGWQQGWVLPEGGAGTVRLDYRPQPVYAWALALGGLAVLLVVGCWLLPARGRRLPSLTGGGPGFADLALVLALGGLLTGWVGVVLSLGAILVVRTVRGVEPWPLLAGGLLLAAAAPRYWPWVADHTTVEEWSQLLAMGAVSVAAAALFANGPLFFRRRNGRSST